MSRTCDVGNSDWPEQLDKRVDLFLVTGSLDDHLRVRNVYHLCAKHVDETQDLLAGSARRCFHGDQRHLALDVWPSGYIVNFTDTRETFALFDDLFDGAIVATRDDRDTRPARVKCFTNRDSFDVEAARAKQTDDPRELARLVGNND